MKVVVSPHNVVNYLQGGGHFWVYLQYVEGLRAIGCDVWWLEEFAPSSNWRADRLRVETFLNRMSRYGLEHRVVLYTADGEFLTHSQREAHELIATTDLLLNFHQKIKPWLLEGFRRSALVDIDPGLLQYWMTAGVLTVPEHDLYFTTGETVGKPFARFPNAGKEWIAIRPPVSLDLWPFALPPADAPFTTVSAWWAGEWVEYGGEVYDNNKRAAFLRFAELPKRTSVALELAIFLDPKSSDDLADWALLERNGWRIRLSGEVAATPESYQAYVQSSLGEFSCAKASCAKFDNAWISDRTLCYLATGRPAVVEYTGPSARLPNGRGLFRFSTLDEAAAALEEARGNYRIHSRAAREIAEAFDARRVAETIVSRCNGNAMAKGTA